MARLELHIEGPKGEISFLSFLSVMEEARLALLDLDRILTAKDRGAIEWKVIQLSMKSLGATIESAAEEPEWAPVADEIGRGFVAGLETIRAEDELPPIFSEVGLNHISKLASKLSRNGATGFSAVNLDSGQRSAVTRDTQQQLRRLRRGKYRTIGSVIGRLETIRLHKKHVFAVYDEFGQRAVSSSFTEDQFDQVKRCLGKRVLVSGIVVRNSHGQLVQVESPNIRQMPSEEDLPRTNDFVGAHPDFTGDLTTEEYIRKLRDG